MCSIDKLDLPPPLVLRETQARKYELAEANNMNSSRLFMKLYLQEMEQPLAPLFFELVLKVFRGS